MTVERRMEMAVIASAKKKKDGLAMRKSQADSPHALLFVVTVFKLLTKNAMMVVILMEMVAAQLAKSNWVTVVIQIALQSVVINLLLVLKHAMMVILKVVMDAIVLARKSLVGLATQHAHPQSALLIVVMD